MVGVCGFATVLVVESYPGTQSSGPKLVNLRNTSFFAILFCSRTWVPGLYFVMCSDLFWIEFCFLYYSVGLFCLTPWGCFPLLLPGSVLCPLECFVFFSFILIYLGCCGFFCTPFAKKKKC